VFCRQKFIPGEMLLYIVIAVFFMSHQTSLAGGDILFSGCLFVRPFVCYETCEHSNV